ncbi:MAG TPA: SAM-dependent methyltransferase [Nostocaceae cyanobacterium]|nr:SAM-dependent methyltransferase [Nostocaceae cyanobacterium]
MENSTIPNTGRILDYWLGGSHHFPIDVEAANIFTNIYPDFPEVFQTLRNYIGRASNYIASQGINQFIVFGSGLPTCGNVHEAVPKAKVLYTDIDQTNIELGQKILANIPHVNYSFCDVTNLDTLDQTIITQTLGSFQKLGLVIVGVTAFIPDEVLTNVLDKLYDWCPEGSFLALDFDGEAGKKYPQLLELMDSFDAHLYMRNPTTIKPLLGRWQLTTPGILPVANWQPESKVESSIDPENVFMYGCVVYK